jgi:hypothetical protein
MTSPSRAYLAAKAEVPLALRPGVKGGGVKTMGKVGR